MYRMIVSALVAGAIIGLMAYQTGTAVKAAVLLGVVAALKDVQAYLSSAPGSPQPQQTPPADAGGDAAP